VNFYLAQSGDYHDPEAHLIAERQLMEPAVSPPQPMRASLFPTAQWFTQDEREYAVFEGAATEPLGDHHEAANDLHFLQLLRDLADGLRELDEGHLRADLTGETLRLDDAGRLRYCGFFDAPPQPQGLPDAAGVPPATAPDSLQQLRDLAQTLLKHCFAPASTLRLDDELADMAFTDEVKQVVRALMGAELSSPAEVVQAIDCIWPKPDPAVTFALLSDVGQERELNEDAGLVLRLERAGHLRCHELDLYAVADGMGGHEGGEVASDLTLNALQRHLLKVQVDWHDNLSVRHAMVELIDAVNADVEALAESPAYARSRTRPGSTLVFALRLGPRLFIGNVGDSRAYLWSAGGGLNRITKDHSYVQNLIDQGMLAEADAWGHPEGSIITAHIGMARLRTRDVFLRLLRPGDKLLLVSDGVVDMLRDREIEALAASGDAFEVCRKLVEAANAAGGNDNITVACAVFS